MKRFVILLLLFIPTYIFCRNDIEKRLILKKFSDNIIIDGLIDPVWNQADSVSDFVQQSQYHHKPPSMRTVAKVITNDNALYCLMICYDDKVHIQNTTGKLDEASGDIVSIMLDTFGDKRTAYKLAVTSSGVRADARLLDDARDRDYNWDGIWFATSKSYDWGFIVEIEIPYKSLQYAKSLNEWGLDFDRWNPSRSEDLYWCSYEENEGQRISKFGKLIFENFYPSVTGLNLEIYPVGIARANYLYDGKYNIDPDLGVDIFYNPSEQLTYQLTANPDFAQIEADPFEFNISRYETYFSERRPFFTEGNEVFKPSGRERNSGFYQPLELFYSRRIGKKLPDGTEVPLILGTRAFGRYADWEYGGFLAATKETDYTLDTNKLTEPSSQFASIRLKKQIFDNSSIGILFVGKHSKNFDNGVLDIDGAFRGSSWQLAYQLAGSYKQSVKDVAASAGYRLTNEDYLLLMRGRYINKDFDIDQVGYVPWLGTGEFVALGGPRWYFKDGYIREILIYTGPLVYYKNVEKYTDFGGLLGLNMQFRDNWGCEINFNHNKAKDNGIIYNSTEVNFSSWFNVSPKWYGNLYGGYAKTYNFLRNYLAFYSWSGMSFGWRVLDILGIGTSYNMFIEGNPNNDIQDITYNARPYFSLTPVNDMNIRVYVDETFKRSTNKIEKVIAGFLFSYNFLPKSWIYLALNDINNGLDGNNIPIQKHFIDKAGVVKVKYLYYF